MARMKTGRLTPKTTNPLTGSRIENPDMPAGSSAGQKGSTYSSWPEVRNQYKQGKQDELFKRKGTTSEVRNYLEGKTDILSEDYSEPIIRDGNTQYSYSKPATFNDDKKIEMVAKMPILKAGKASTSKKMAGPKKEKSTEGFFGDYVPSTKGTSNKQLKQFASYASKTGLSESFVGKSKAEIGQYKDEMKSQRRSYAKEGNLAGVKATTADIRQSINAAKFVGSKNPMDVPGMVKGYQRSEGNAVNRNTIKTQVERLKKLR
jgi:hypothetical protein